MREVELRAYDVLNAEDIPALEHIADLGAAACGMSTCEVNVVTATDVVHASPRTATTSRCRGSSPSAAG